jgi:shikimate dehydrogenase
VKLAVIGDPVAHSRSPRLHAAFLEEAGIDGSYVALRVPSGSALDAIRRMRDEGYTGCNVTYPLKEEALSACDTLDEEARRVGAVNTILFGAAIAGSNTDGVGARSALETLLDEPIALKRIGVLGYGATARAILAQFGENDAYSFVWGRDEAKVAAACAAFDARPFDTAHPPEIVISTLPPDAQLPQDVIEALGRADVVMDANYGERSKLGRILRREVVPGDAMLEGQARASFDTWLVHAVEL